jgi:hypothetical protein
MHSQILVLQLSTPPERSESDPLGLPSDLCRLVASGMRTIRVSRRSTWHILEEIPVPALRADARPQSDRRPVLLGPVAGPTVDEGRHLDRGQGKAPQGGISETCRQRATES